MYPGAILEICLRVGVISLNVTPRHVLLTIFLRLYSPRVQMPVQGALSAVFCTKLRLIHRVRLVWRHKITNLLSKNSFCTGQRVVSRPLRPLARMAHSIDLNFNLPLC